ncbi:MAG: hypothetical protein RI553_09290, partial [Salibaculum sp.]|nr:hypothetical protein [Salibaculum sp.]
EILRYENLKSVPKALTSDNLQTKTDLQGLGTRAVGKQHRGTRNAEEGAVEGQAENRCIGAVGPGGRARAALGSGPVGRDSMQIVFGTRISGESGGHCHVLSRPRYWPDV